MAPLDVNAADALGADAPDLGSARLETRRLAEVLIRIKSSVLFGEVLQILRQLLERVDRLGRAGRDASTAVDATVWIDIELGGGFKCGFILFRMDAVGWTSVHTEKIFDAGIGNHISHDEVSNQLRVGVGRRMQSNKRGHETAVTDVTRRSTCEIASHACVTAVTA